jgi:hypothetical protein
MGIRHQKQGAAGRSRRGDNGRRDPVFQHRPKDAPSPRSAQASQSSTV